MKLFGSGVFDIIREIENPWDGLVFLRSAPGGGKTTLLRLLTPRPLKLVGRLVDTSDVKATHDRLLETGAVSANGSEILGTMVSFTTEYRELAEYDRGNSLFRELVSSRIVIAVLRTLIERSARVYPRDLEMIQIEWEPESDATIPAKANGRELYEWASKIENGFYERMDDLGEPGTINGGHARLDGLSWFAKAKIEDVDGPVTTKRVLLLDEMERLAKEQRSSLIEYFTNARENCGIWVAERLEALDHEELLSEGALQQRDYKGVIQLERRWAERRSKAYARFVEQIANLRAAKAEGFEERGFYSWIADSDDVATWGPVYEDACKKIQRRIDERVGEEMRYREWVKCAARFNASAWEKAARWRMTEILVAQDMGRAQTELPFLVLTGEDFKERSSRIKEAAEHFLRREVGAPLYFGREAIADVSSSNVNQYLEVTGELFAEVMAKFSGFRTQPSPLTTDRQDAIIRRVAKQRWDGLVRSMPQGSAARRFLLAFEKFSAQQTFRPTVPYAPGVTGFAITMAERETLIDTPDGKSAHLTKLRDVLSSLVAHNLLIPYLNRQQGGRSVVVFYLNRLLCVQFELPLGRGGWRHRPLMELNTWLEKGVAAVPDISEGELV